VEIAGFTAARGLPQGDMMAFELSTRDVKEMSLEEIVNEGEAIIQSFYKDCEGGTQFGCDWPTMRTTFPERCARFDALKQEAVMNKGYKGVLLRKA
jgi:hypothetical protein